MRSRKRITGKNSCDKQFVALNALVCLLSLLVLEAFITATAMAADPEGPAVLAQAYALKDRALNEQLVGDFGLAAQHMDEACKLARKHWSSAKPVMGELYFDLGKARELAGQDEQAIAAFKNCLLVKPDHTICRVHLARLLFRSGKEDEAIAEARLAEKNDPQCGEAKLVLSLLLKKVNPHDADAKRLEKEAFSVNKIRKGPKETLETENKKEELLNPENASQQADQGRQAPYDTDTDEEIHKALP